MPAETLSPSPSAAPATPALAGPPPAARVASGVVAQSKGDGHRHGERAARRPVEVGPSLLRMSLGGRLLLALVALIPLWAAVVLVVG